MTHVHVVVGKNIRSAVENKRGDIYVRARTKLTGAKKYGGSINGTEGFSLT